MERRYSRSRLRRAIFGSMLGYTMADLAEKPLYTSLLAANEVGRGMTAGITIPAISRPSDYKKLPRDAREQFERAIRADYLQELCSENGLEIWKRRCIALDTKKEKAPITAIGDLTTEELNKELGKGMAEVRAGNTIPEEEFLEELRRDYGL